ncbi:hypothetical protein [Cellvibrio sp. PSBB023]|uniref:hypothetical protein n=1 Tax=Cellvibrio sp. PSBB023 TaxID=1945512 RepID=UPI00098F1BA1|nr:hypothetical protein [Cellvibrio sp. PSBB023]AQT59144.1 hypothetical protein B0D95_02870 [Cellvibrio sp. PSBB023]
MTFKDAQQANTIENLKFPTIDGDIPPVTRIYDLVVKQAKEKSQSEKYIDFKSELDLIFFTLQEHVHH